MVDEESIRKYGERSNGKIKSEVEGLSEVFCDRDGCKMERRE